MINTKMIKLKPDTIEILQNLKITKRESYDEVINRLFMQTLLEDQLELGEASKQVLLNRIKSLNEGKIKSFGQILESFRQKKEVAIGRKRGEKVGRIKPNPGEEEPPGKETNATVES